jgi:hypothetical protein
MVARACIYEILIVYPLKEIIPIEFLLKSKMEDPMWSNLTKMEYWRRICATVTMEAEYQTKASEIVRPSIDFKCSRVKVEAVDSPFERILDMNLSNLSTMAP